MQFRVFLDREKMERENEQLNKIDHGAIYEFKIQACFRKVFAKKTQAIWLSLPAAALGDWGPAEEVG